MKSNVFFADAKINQAYKKLKDSKTEDKLLYKWISRAINDLRKDAFCGVQIQKKIIPKIYVNKYSIDNLWKYDLPNGWRLIYSVADDEIVIISIILEWMTHKEYEKRFKY